MNIQIAIALLLAASVISSHDDDGASKTARKHYGLSYHSKCNNYVKSFTCMTTCKSIGFQVFRMDFRCKCSCHELKTTTILPFFKWRTTGTTKTLPNTQSPQLYHIAGTMSPPSSFQDTDNTKKIKTTTNAKTCGPPADNSTASNSKTASSTTPSNATPDEASGNATNGADAITLPADEATPLPADEATPLPAGESTPLPAGESTPLPAGEATSLPAGESTPPPAGEATDQATALPANAETPAPAAETAPE